jgi:hypothetical protein
MQHFPASVVKVNNVTSNDVLLNKFAYIMHVLTDIGQRFNNPELRELLHAEFPNLSAIRPFIEYIKVRDSIQVISRGDIYIPPPLSWIESVVDHYVDSFIVKDSIKLEFSTNVGVLNPIIKHNAINIFIYVVSLIVYGGSSAEDPVFSSILNTLFTSEQLECVRLWFELIGRGDPSKFVVKVHDSNKVYIMPDYHWCTKLVQTAINWV